MSRPRLVWNKCHCSAVPKFFNDDEHPEGFVPWHLPHEVTEKLDGSLLIVFFYANQWIFATRGSFESEQAVRGKAIFEKLYDYDILDKKVTYLFEVIFKENRIVVNYGDTEDVILIGMIETYPNRELSLDEAPPSLHVVRRVPFSGTSNQLRSIIRDDEEGYVVRFENGFRIKVKGDRYKRLHRILTGVSSRTIWEYLSQNKSFDEMLELVPDEFGQWVRMERANFIEMHDCLARRAARAIDAVALLSSRKDKALAIMSNWNDVSSLAFALLDGKPIEDIIWKKLYPEYRIPKVAERIES